MGGEFVLDSAGLRSAIEGLSQEVQDHLVDVGSQVASRAGDNANFSAVKGSFRAERSGQSGAVVGSINPLAHLDEFGSAWSGTRNRPSGALRRAAEEHGRLESER